LDWMSDTLSPGARPGCSTHSASDLLIVPICSEGGKLARTSRRCAPPRYDSHQRDGLVLQLQAANYCADALDNSLTCQDPRFAHAEQGAHLHEVEVDPARLQWRLEPAALPRLVQKDWQCTDDGPPSPTHSPQHSPPAGHLLPGSCSRDNGH
jgi:hypothetical protein